MPYLLEYGSALETAVVQPEQHEPEDRAIVGVAVVAPQSDAVPLALVRLRAPLPIAHAQLDELGKSIWVPHVRFR